jgi:ATP-dependent RNA helicase DDX27
LFNQCIFQGSQVEAKEAVLLSLCSRSFGSGRTIIFAKTKQRAHRIKILFGLAELPLAVELHGNMTQVMQGDFAGDGCCGDQEYDEDDDDGDSCVD